MSRLSTQDGTVVPGPEWISTPTPDQKGDRHKGGVDRDVFVPPLPSSKHNEDTERKRRIKKKYYLEKFMCVLISLSFGST